MHTKKPISNSLNSAADSLSNKLSCLLLSLLLLQLCIYIIVVVLYQPSYLRDGTISLSTPTSTLALKSVNLKADDIYLYYRLCQMSARGFYTTMVLSKEALKARVAAYKEAMEEAANAAAEAAVNAAANAVAGAPPGEPGGGVNQWL